MSLIARLMDRRNRKVIAKLAQEKEKHPADERDADELFEKGAYTNGIQGL